MNRILPSISALIASAFFASACGVWAVETNNPAFRSYAVNRGVTDFPTNEDLSTPEAAYASLARAWAAEGEAVFARLEVAANRGRSAPSKPLPAKDAAVLLGAEVLEVIVYRQTNAVVLARQQSGTNERIDMRWLRPEKGRWLNYGHDNEVTLEKARQRFARSCAYTEAKIILASRPPVANPQEYLRPFVEFLRTEAADPQALLLKALADHQVVILGEVHHRPRYWAFNSALVRTKAFPERVGVIYMELPSNDQPLVEQFLAAPKYDPQPIIEMLRDNLWTGWPDQPMLDFFKAVWEANQTLPAAQRLRIVIVDQKQPWKEIINRADLRKYRVDRNHFMADNVVQDLREHRSDPRHALFIVGYAHAMVNLTLPDGEPMKSAGWHLREQLGETNVFAVFPHSPVIDNWGALNGRIALGLFETAFAALTNRPMAFPLDHGPFGEQIFDAQMDNLTTNLFRSGYHAYLYLGPLEDEVFSPLIPGFHSDEFAKEMDRRCRLESGKGLVESGYVKRVDGARVIEWLNQGWGKPRHEWSARSLGPLRAWEGGGDWEKRATAAKLKQWQADKESIRQAAQHLFEAIRQADYEHPGNWRFFPAPDAFYQVYTDKSAWQRWICQHFCTNPIVRVDLGEVRLRTNGLPAMTYQVALKNDAKLEGLLPMNYDACSEAWFGTEGLDWHLHPPKAALATNP